MRGCRVSILVETRKKPSELLLGADRAGHVRVSYNLFFFVGRGGPLGGPLC